MSVAAMMPSPSVKRPHGLVNSTVIMPTKCYGELLINSEGSVVLRCTTCQVEQRAYKQFLEHIFAHYRTETLCLLSASAMPLNKTISKASAPLVSPAVEIRRTPRRTRTTLGFGPNSSNSHKEPLAISSESRKDQRELRKEPLAVIDSHDGDSLCDGGGVVGSTPLVAKNKGKRKKLLDIRQRCELCNITFNDWTQKYSHLRRHHADELPYTCSDCEMRFISSGELRMHQRQRHTLERPFMCAYCGQCFAQNSHMRDHERQHEEGPTYQCEFCNKEFVSKARLREHLAVHAKAAKYECDECNEKFHRRKNYINHKAMHTANGKKFECDLCDMTFNHATALWLHRRHVHKVLKPSMNKSKIDEVYEQLQSFMKDAIDVAKAAKNKTEDGGDEAK